MLARRIIPCLDVKDGRVVKGVQFIHLRDAGDPVEQARSYDRMGADELVFLDISASPEGRQTTAEMVRRVADQVFLPLTVGGGIRSAEDMRRILLAGADKVSVNTAAVLQPEILSQGAERFGSQCVVLAIDARRRAGGGWEVYTHGGRTPTGIDAIQWAARGVALGAGEILLTSMDADGSLDGYDLALTRTVASGGQCAGHRQRRGRQTGRFQPGAVGRARRRPGRRCPGGLTVPRQNPDRWPGQALPDRARPADPPGGVG